jgi:hypothetical protein
MHYQLPPLPEPALKRMPTGNVYFTPQQMQEYGQAARATAMEDARGVAEGRAATAVNARDDQGALAAEEIADRIGSMIEVEAACQKRAEVHA